MIDPVRLKAVYVRILQAIQARDIELADSMLEMAAIDLEVVLGQAGVPLDEVVQMKLEGLRS